MKRFRWLFLVLALALMAACVSAAGAEDTVTDGFILRDEGDIVFVTGAEDTAVRDGVVTIPETIGGKNVAGFEPSLMREGIRLVIFNRNAGLYSTEDNAPDSTVEINCMTYAGFRELSPDEMDRLPDIQKGEYALTDYFRMTVLRNGSHRYSRGGSDFVYESDIPQELFGRTAYNLIDRSVVARSEGDWTYVIQDDFASIRKYTGPADRTFVIPGMLDGWPVREFAIAMIPAEAEFVYVPSEGRWGNPMDDQKRSFTAIEYTSYERAQVIRPGLLEEIPDFAPDTCVALSIYTVDYDGEQISTASPDGLFFSTGDLLEEIGGQKLSLQRVSSYIMQTEGDWSYVIRPYDKPTVSITGYAGAAEETFIVPLELNGMKVESISIAAIPETAKTVFKGWNTGTDSQDGQTSRNYLQIDYVDYELAVSDMPYLVEQYPDFTADACAAVSISDMTYDGRRFSNSSPDRKIPGGDLPSEIGGKTLLLYNIGDWIEFTAGDWTYTTRQYDTPRAVITGYTGAGEETFVIPAELNGMRVTAILISAIPDNAKYVYKPDDVSIETGSGEQQETEDRSFIILTTLSYRQAADSGYYYVDSYPEFTDGMTAVTSVRQFTYRASNTTTSSGGLSEKLIVDKVLTEIDGSPLFLGGIGDDLAYISGEYTYTKAGEGKVYYQSGPVTDGVMIIPARIDGMEVYGYSLSGIPEDVTEVFAPGNSYCRSYNLSHTVRVYNYFDYDEVQTRGYTVTGMKQGEYLLVGAYYYSKEKSESLVQDYYLYPTSLGGHKIHNGLNSGNIKQYESGKFTYFKLSAKEICICKFSDNDARKVSIPSTLDDLTVVGIKGLGSGTVFNVSNAESISLPKKLRILGNNAIYSSKLKSLKLPSGLKEIGSNAIYAGSITKLEIPESVTSIGSRFISAWNVKKIVIPDSVKNIAAGALNNSGAQSITLPSGMTEIPEDLCRYSYYLISIKIPKNVTFVGKNAFQNCSSLKTVSFKGGKVKKIMESAFADCAALTDIKLPKGLEEIERQAFYNCAGLKEIEIPSSVTKIGEYAFNGCKAMTKITLGSKVKSIAGNAFAECNKKKLTFYAPKDSYAYEWAKKKGFKVKNAK